MYHVTKRIFNFERIWAFTALPFILAGVAVGIFVFEVREVLTLIFFGGLGLAISGFIAWIFD